MKKVLIIAFLSHASPRIPGLAKYLPGSGWQPIILTPSLGEKPDSHFGPPNDLKGYTKVIETYGYSPKDKRMYSKVPFGSKKCRVVQPFLKFLFKSYQEFAYYPDSEKGWKPFAIKASSELLQNEGVDAIISSSSPVRSHLIARELKNRYDIPWVADFRDLWTQNHNYAYAHYPYGPLRKLIEKRLELRTLSMADALVTVSSPMAEKLKMLHKGKRVYAITNGFDPELMNDGKADLTSKFTITYTGQIYKKQAPSKLLIALRDLISERAIDPNDASVRFYGPENQLLAKEIEEHGLSNVVKQYGIIPRAISFEKQRESQLLLHMNWEDPREKGAYSLKIFEYLAAQRPILTTGGFGNDVVEALLHETHAGTYCSSIEDVKNALRESYSEYRTNGRVSYSGNLERINRYSYREMARKFAEVLGNVAKNR